MAVLEQRNISGIYFRFENPETGKWENRVFEDLPEERQKSIVAGQSKEWVENLALSLAKALRKVCDDFDIVTE